jgi:amino acid transporter
LTDAADEHIEQEERAEDAKKRLEREHTELLHELRSLIPGAEVLLGFLLAITFTSQFDTLDDTQRYVFYATLVSTALAIVLYLAPAAYHRLRFREGDKDYMLRKGNRETIAGTAFSAFALTGVIYLLTSLVFGAEEAVVAAVAFFAFVAWRWWSHAIYRNLRDE